MKKIKLIPNATLMPMITVALVVLSAEFLFMALLHETIIPMLPFEISHTGWDLVDAVTITAITTPVLYFLVFKRIQQSEEYLRQIATAAQDAIIVIDGQGRITEWNLAAQKMFQYQREEVLGQQLHQLITPARLLADADRGFSSFLRSANGEMVGKTTEISALRRDGQEIPVELSISAFEVKNVTHTIGIIRDITARKRSEAELIAARKLAEDASQSKSAFLARMGHELLTPLNAIIGFAQAIDMSADDETIAAHRDSIRTIIRSGWNLHRIIKDILGLSEIETRKVEVRVEKIDVAGCINLCCDLIAPLAREHGIKLDCAIEELENVTVLADPFRLHEVLTNLLDNAIKYNREGGSVTLSGQKTPDYLRIMVSDTGQGIAEDEIHTLFQPFSRLAKRSYSIEGAGVGLASARQLTELMGGSIGVESVYGQGSMFWIELPVA